MSKCPANEDFGEFVLHMRKACGLTQAQLAALLNCHVSCIVAIEKGYRLPEDVFAFEYELRSVIKQEVQKRRVEGTLHLKGGIRRRKSKKISV